jgi:AraC family transcriptional regulator
MTQHAASRPILGHTLQQRGAENVTLSSMRPTVPAHEVAMHTHAEAHLMLVTAGDYVSSADDARARSRGKPLAIFNPPGTEHADCFAPGQNLRRAHFYSLCIGPAAWRELSDAVDLPGWAQVLSAMDARTMAQRVMGQLAHADAEPFDLDCLAAEILACVERPFRESLTSAPAWLAAVRADLREDWRSALAPAGLAALACRHGIHAVHLARIFRRFQRCSPGDFARRRRLELAAALLADSRRTLADIAADCGFFDQAHLTRSFAAANGYTPQQYRRALSQTEKLQPYNTAVRGLR